MSKKNITSGRNANQNGKYVEDCVHDFLHKVCGYEYIPPNKFLVTSHSLRQKLFTRQLAICDSTYSLTADFVLYNPKLEVKYFIIQLIGEKMMKESELQAAIVSALELKGYFVYMNYQNIAGRFAGDSNSSSYGHYRSLVNQGWKKGIPDLHVIGKNIDIYIECKSKKGKISPAQQEVMDTLVHFGREVRVVNDISQIQDLLDMDL